MGSKARIAKYIVPIIQQRIEDYNIKIYIEPFAGGMNIIDKIKCKRKIASDNNKYLIELFKNAEKVKDLPENIGKERYDECRNSYHNNDGKFPDWYLGAVGFLSSYSSRFYDGGYSNSKFDRGETNRNHFAEHRRNFEEQIPRLHGIEFIYGDYKELYPLEANIENCLLYCDIPYKDTKQYDTSKNFNYDAFWHWAEEMSANNILLVSEYTAPEEWECIWSKPLPKTMNAGKNVNAVEKLFELKR